MRRREFKIKVVQQFSTPLMAIEPIVYHRPSQCFGVLAVAGYDFAGASNIAWINGYEPFVSFDPGADGVPDAPVFHSDILGSNRKPGNQSHSRHHFHNPEHLSDGLTAAGHVTELIGADCVKGRDQTHEARGTECS